MPTARGAAAVAAARARGRHLVRFGVKAVLSALDWLIVAGATILLYGDDGDVVLDIPIFGESVLLSVPLQPPNQVCTSLGFRRCFSREVKVGRFKDCDVGGHVMIL